jgi:hypothetical protein
MSECAIKLLDKSSTRIGHCDGVLKAGKIATSSSLVNKHLVRESEVNEC